MRYAMIMAGGAGTRLWPMSRRDRPKQLLPLIARHGKRGDGPARSLLEIAAARLEGLVDPDRRYICTGEAFRKAVREALPQFTDDHILGEPVGRDTVNAVGFGAAVFQKLDPSAVFIVLTADHLIEPEEVFRQRADLAFRLVEQDPKRLVTFSIKPTYPATAYGWIERGPVLHGLPGAAGLAFRVERFVEKPDLNRAQAYLESGHFAWNSGMFVFSAPTFQECLQRFKPDSHAGILRIQQAWGTKKQKAVIEEVYPALPKISVDYAVMEPAARDQQVTVCTVLTDVRWLDVGSWTSYAETLTPDKAGNRVGGPGASKALLVHGKRNLVVNDDGSHTIAVLGAEDLIVVHTRDATLVMPRARAEELKALHGLVDESLQ